MVQRFIIAPFSKHKNVTNLQRNLLIFIIVNISEEIDTKKQSEMEEDMNGNKLAEIFVNISIING